MGESCFAYKLKSREEIVKEIEVLRYRLADLIKAKGTLDDPEVLSASQELDIALNDYYLWDDY